MSRYKKERMPLAFKNPNRAWVMSELDKLYRQWLEWAEYVKTIEDHPYDRNRQAECFADGEENIHKHDILREKTLVFLDNNIQGHDFMLSQRELEPFEDRSGRLRTKAPHRLKELEILRATLEYALVPDRFWKEQGKRLVQRLAEVTPDKVVEVAAAYLRDPLGASND